VNGQAGAVRILLEAGADSNKGNSYGSTPLHWATVDGRVDIVSILVAGGADPTARRSDGKTAFQIADEWRLTECSEALSAHKST
jgi:ankyrin repeat protein